MYMCICVLPLLCLNIIQEVITQLYYTVKHNQELIIINFWYNIILNKNILGVKKCEINMKQHCKWVAVCTNKL